MKSYRYILEGLDCANCAKKIEDKIASTEGYKDVSVNFSTLKLSFKSDKENVKQEITTIVNSLEPEVKVLEKQNEDKENVQRNNLDILRIAIGMIVYLLGTYLNFGRNITIFLDVIALVILLSKTTKKAYTQVFKNKVLDENTLITISVIGACLVDKVAEGVMVITLYEIGKILEARAIGKTRKSISDLMNIKPEYANLKNGEEIQKVNPEEVKIGDIILIKTGEKIPLDGIIIKGNAEIDNSCLTGESALIKVKENQEVLSGGINVEGLIEVEVQKTYENSTVNQILNLVENATDKKAKTETFVARAAKIYTPIVLGLAVIVAIFMPIFFKDITYSQSIYRALTFLVISCPCAIAISVPLSYFSGIGVASKKGILIKGSEVLDNIKNITKIAFDKTGTLTTGKFNITKITSLDDKYSEDDIFKYIYFAEKYSLHPLAKTVLNYKKVKGLSLSFSDITFKQYAEKWFDINISTKEIATQNSVKNRLKHIYQYIGNVKLKNLKRYQIQEIQTAMLKDGYTDITNRTIAECKRILEDAVNNDIIEKNVANGIKAKKFPKTERKPLTQYEDLKVLECAKNNKYGIFILILRYCGIRPEEAVALTIKDVDLDNQLLNINKAVSLAQNQPTLKATKNLKNRKMQ